LSRAAAPQTHGKKLGLELNAEAGAFLAAASSTNFRVALNWRRGCSPTTAPSANVAGGGLTGWREAAMRAAPSFENFDVLLERSGEGFYRARVVFAPAGQGARVAFAQPFAPLELENFLLRIGRPRRPVRRVDAPETKAIKDFGQRLYDALFHDDLRVSLERSLSEAAAKGAGLRLRLRLSDTPELAELPWEFLYDKARNRFVCLSDRTPLIRFLEVPDPPRPLPVSPPLRILVMISSPNDPHLADLDVEQEWTKLHGVLTGLEQAGLVRRLPRLGRRHPPARHVAGAQGGQR
jgi:hypothetical protein